MLSTAGLWPECPGAQHEDLLPSASPRACPPRRILWQGLHLYQLMLPRRHASQELLLERHCLHARWCSVLPLNQQQHPLAAGLAAVPQAACLQVWSTMQRQHGTASVLQASALVPAAAPSKRLSRPQEHELRSAWQSCLVTYFLYSVP